ncbi:MAG: Asp-tRNA(Asn)/Glu-tRNA(Gln) amidotransferase subunit GatA [Fimbriimonadaceae bacterium]|nr:Asp-tRNA(Asn)/Glu-tRNA(Gln) amidotransferase subunit GatA [Fimbriimonadaceae bacterium]
MPTRLSATRLAARLAAKELGVREVAQAHLDRIATLDATLGAFLTVDPDETMRWADAAQAKIDAGEAGPLTGVPIAIKDNLCTAGVRTTCASRILESHVPIYDATVVRRLREAGCVMVGKTNLDEFAMGTSTENSAFQVTRNPWDFDRSPGGSSGGSAAAVAAEMAPLALGSDTGGSIRQPASLCGIVGFKPTYGRCSRYGLVAFGSSLDQIGPFARTVEDAALLAEAITGHDRRDSTSANHPAIATQALKSGTLRGARLGVLKETLGESTDPRVTQGVERALDALRAEGADVHEVSIPSIGYGVTTYYIIAPAEASSNLARFDGVRYGLRVEGKGHIGMMEATRAAGFGHEVKARIMIGTYALSAGYYDAFYLRAQQVRALMRRDLEAAFQDFDLLVSPTSPVPAFKIGELTSDPLALKMLDYCTIPANMGGFPALSLNCGFADGLPIGLHLMGPVLGDERLLQLAYCVERALPDATGRPPLP